MENVSQKIIMCQNRQSKSTATKIFRMSTIGRTHRRPLCQSWRLGVFSGSHGSALAAIPKRFKIYFFYSLFYLLYSKTSFKTLIVIQNEI